MPAEETVKLARDTEAIVIPAGYRIVLQAGTRVTITQALGGSYTVITDMGYMVRIDDKDADALGKEAVKPPTQAPATEADLEKLIWDQLRTCYDPEIPVNVVDLGLVYACEVKPLPDGTRAVEIRLTLTAPGCGMGDVLKQDIERKVAALPGVGAVDVELVLDPPWTPDKMSEAAKLELGMF